MLTVGRLELESTCSSLIWGSVPSNTKSVQIFTLRNRGSHKEKLHLRIKDNKNCFKVCNFFLKKLIFIFIQDVKLYLLLS